MNFVSCPIVIRNRPITEPFVLRDAILDGSGDIALHIQYEPPEITGPVIFPTVTLDNVLIRGTWRIGVRLENCWNAKLTNVNVCNWPVTEESLSHPPLEYGIDCWNSMDVHIINPNINGAQTAIRIKDLDLNGHGEGFHVHNGWLMNVGTGVKIEGFGSGGWPTPVAHVTNMHIAFLNTAIDVRKYFDVHITDNNIYGAERSRYPVGLYAGTCRTLHVRNNTFWQNKLNMRDGVAMSFDDCTQIRLRDNVVEPNWVADCVIDQRCTKVAEGGNEWDETKVWRLHR